MKKIILCSLLLFVLIRVHAQDTTLKPTARVAPWFVERFKLTAGLFIPVNNTNVQVGVNGESNGTEIDFENDLGFNATVATFIGDFQWRASRRSRFDLSYFNVSRKSDHTLDKEIIFGDSTYDVNTNVNAFFNTNIFRFSYGYALLEKPKFEVGLLIGAHIVGNKTGISVRGEFTDIDAASDFNFTAPLPNFGIWGGYAFTDKLAINIEADYLAISIGDIRGSIMAYNATLSYRILPMLHAALGYTGLNFKVDVEKEHLNGHLKWGYNGPSLTASYTFGKKYWVH